MQDPQITIRNAIKNQWSLIDDLAPGKILFTTGWYDKKFKQPQITVTCIALTPTPFELGYGTVRITDVYQIDIWVAILRKTGSGPGKAQDYKWMMREETLRILKSNQQGLTDIKELVLERTGRSLDDSSAEPPLLRWSQDVTVIYDIS